MIVSCPECGARYRLADDAIPPDGRAMRCASCKHRWFELGPEPEPIIPAEPAVSAERLVATADPLGETEPLPEPVAADEPGEAGEAGEADEPGRGGAVLKSILAVVLGLGFTAGAAAMWVPAGTIDLSQVPWLAAIVDPPKAPPSPLTIRFSTDPQAVAGGRVLYGVTGVLTNPTDEPQAVPPLEGRLVDPSGAVAYRWIIRDGGAMLLPGQSVAFDASALGAFGERVIIAH